jgi:hypothetical protein
VGHTDDDGPDKDPDDTPGDESTYRPEESKKRGYLRTAGDE